MKNKPEALTRDQAVEIAVAVAVELTARSPQPWTVLSEKPGEFSNWDNYVRLGAREGHGVHLRFDGYGNEGRISVSGLWPTYKDNRGSTQTVAPGYGEADSNGYKEITVSRDKDPTKIGADIRTRFITGYLKLHALLKKRADNYAHAAKVSMDAAQKLAAKFSSGERVVADGLSAKVYIDTLGYVNVAAHGQEISVNIGHVGSLTMAKAEKVIAILKEG